MSSSYVRTTVKQFLTDEAPAENQIDLTALYKEVKEMISEAGLGPTDPWLGLQFIGNDEAPITIPATNSSGKYRETGVIFFHVVCVAKLGVGDAILARGETLRNLLRGRRIGSIVIESVTPMNFEAGATLQFEGGYMSGSFIASHERDLDL
jgi:hypothetical protein